MFDTLSGDYIRGYTKAILDIIKVWEYIQPDLTYHHKQLNAKLGSKLLQCCLNNRSDLREDINGFIRFNGSKQDFEFYKPDKS